MSEDAFSGFAALAEARGPTAPAPAGAPRAARTEASHALPAEMLAIASRNIKRSPARDALAVSQAELDAMTDEERWQWAKDAIHAEQARAADEDEEAWAEQQTTIEEGHQ